MKLLFISALLINIFFFVYNIFFASASDVAQQDPLTADKTQIVLLSELDTKQLKELAIKEPPVELNFVEDEAEIAAETELVDTDSLSDNSQTTVSAIDKVSEETKKEVVKPVLKPTPTPVKRVVKKVPIKTGPACYVLGPFTKNRTIRIRSELDAKYNDKLSFEIQATSATSYYRVYIPPINDKYKLAKSLLKLNKSGLKDHYVMNIDNRKNTIALGVYTEKSIALEVSNRARSIGFSTTIGAISKDENSLYKLKVYFKKTDNLAAYDRLIRRQNLKPNLCGKF